MEKQDTFTEKLITQIIKNLQVKISNIHIRFEDDVSILIDNTCFYVHVYTYITVYWHLICSSQPIKCWKLEVYRAEDEMIFLFYTYSCNLQSFLALITFSWNVQTSDYEGKCLSYHHLWWMEVINLAVYVFLKYFLLYLLGRVLV